MLAFSPQEDRRSARRKFARWWRNWMGVRTDEWFEMARLGTGDVTPSAVNESEPVPHDADEPDLLRCRMITLDLDPYEWALSERALIRDLHRRCARCEGRERCAVDLAAESTDALPQEHQEWRKYCPNVATLDRLREVQKRAGGAPKYTFPYLG